MSASDELTDSRTVERATGRPAVRAAALRARAYELARFLSVGGIAFVVDLGLFNLLRFGPGEVLGHKPLTAKVISVVAATLVVLAGQPALDVLPAAHRPAGARARRVRDASTSSAP